MKRRSFSSSPRLAKPQAAAEKPEQASARGKGCGNTMSAALSRRKFSVRLLSAAEAAPLLAPQEQKLLHAESPAFFLYETGQDAPLGFCLIRRRADAPQDDAPQKSKKFLEIALFRLYAAETAKRAKTLLLHAVADYCRRQEVDYIFGQFSFSGKYPAAYAREFSCLYHYYRMKPERLPPFAQARHDAARRAEAKNASMDIMPAEAVPPDKSRRFLPPLLRYCLRLGAKTGDCVTIDKNYNHGAGAMNVLLLLPALPAAKAPEKF